LPSIIGRGLNSERNLPGDEMKDEAKGLFLDRDGTLIEHIPYLHDPQEVRLVKGARNALSKVMDEGFRIFLFSNQSGVGRGMFTMNEVEACNTRMVELLDIPGAIFTETCIAPEKPGESAGYRKPNPRFIVEMIRKYDLNRRLCWMIGDSECDVQAAGNARIDHRLLNASLSLEEAIDDILISIK